MSACGLDFGTSNTTFGHFISWSCTDSELTLNWRESGGPPVAPPTRYGFGRRLIEKSPNSKGTLSFAHLNYEVVGTAGNVPEALQLIGLNSCDFALLDLDLNGSDSYTIARRLRDRGVPFIFVTGYGAAGLNPEWRDIHVLKKPFDDDDLRAAVDKIAVKSTEA